ncbi:MAG TPA: oligosaccharide flippase family protein [Candidatus Paceibacterota bacterium]|nr:oligosaccharide flippase family protein [Candidatus Paceibacterota bacterium]
MPPLKDRLYRLLRWSEKYTKTDMVYLASGGFWTTFAQIVAAAAVLIFAIVVGRFLPKEVYGEYKYVLAAVAILSTFSLSGIGSAVFQSVARGFDGALHEGFWANIRWSALVFLGAFALAAYYLMQGNATLAFGVLIGGCLSPFLTSANLAGAFLGGKRDFARSSIYFGIIETLLSVGALIVTVMLTHDVLALVAVYFLSNTLATLWLYRRVTRTYAPDTSKTDPGMLTYGKHLSLIGILGGIASNIDQLLVFHFVGPAELAVYNFAIAMPDQLKAPSKALDQMIQARFVGRPQAHIESGMANKVLVLALASVVLVALYIFAAPILYDILFPRYADAIPYSQVYALSLLATITLTPTTSWLSAKKRVREQYVSATAIGLVRIALMVSGVLIAGLWGLIIARVLARLFASGLNAFLFYHPLAPAEE